MVNDQFGRLTYTDDLAHGIRDLLAEGVPFGTCNITSDVPLQSWYEIARDVFIRSGRGADAVTGVSTEEYFAGKRAAPRPRQSALKPNNSNDKIGSIRFGRDEEMAE